MKQLGRSYMTQAIFSDWPAGNPERWRQGNRPPPPPPPGRQCHCFPHFSDSTSPGLEESPIGWSGLHIANQNEGSLHIPLQW
jgi:hypothetical protein